MTHILDTTMIYIHPPLSMIGYAFVFLSFALVLIGRRGLKDVLPTKRFLYVAWFFNLLGLISGMLWAQLAWGSYWSWDPKETLTLFLFICTGLSAVFYEQQKKISFIVLLLAIVCIAVNIFITIGDFGLHSYNL